MAKSVEPCLGVTEHTAEHYGLLIAYYRANGLVPPASRPRNETFANEWLQLDASITDVYTYNRSRPALEEQSADALFALPCACQSLRRLSRVVTRIYDQELRRAGLEITQFGLLTALAAVGEANQKRLSAGLAMDSTTLTRTLGLLRKQGWVHVRHGKDRRERLFSLTKAGERQMTTAQPHWERAERRLRKELGEVGWKTMKQTVSRMTEAGVRA
jgi:DNA-binding MarR family transcriptional regulator